MGSIIKSAVLPANLSLANKVAIVTGGSRNIGAAIALELARRGSKVALVYRSDSSTALAQKVAAQIEELGSQATLIQADLSTLDCGARIVNQTLAGLGVTSIDIVVNNAAADPPFSSVAETDPKHFEENMNINVRGPLVLVQALLPHLSPQNGRIINISSILARTGGSNLCVYASTKAALECMTRQWAHELAKPYKLTVNTIQLGEIEVEAVAAEVPDSFREAQLELPSAARRFGSTQEVANIAAFLASEGSSWMNGDTLSCSGGTVYI